HRHHVTNPRDHPNHLHVTPRDPRGPHSITRRATRDHVCPQRARAESRAAATPTTTPRHTKERATGSRPVTLPIHHAAHLSTNQAGTTPAPDPPPPSDATPVPPPVPPQPTPAPTPP